MIGYLAGSAISVWIIMSELGLFLGAALGGTLHQVVTHDSVPKASISFKGGTP